MKGRIAIMSALAALAPAACGYPSFVFDGSTGTGGHGGQPTTTSVVGSTSGTGGQTATTTSTSATSATTATTSTSATSGTGTTTGTGAGGSPPTCPVDHLLISQLMSRGPMGADDEFIDLYNPTDADVVLDSTWTIVGRNASSLFTSSSTRWKGSSSTLHARGYYLIVGSKYSESAMPDDQLTVGITDAESIALEHAGTPVDSLCYYNDSLTDVASEDDLESGLFTCEGNPVLNPHDDSDDTDVDASLERKTVNGAPDCADTGDNASDFEERAPSAPDSSTSPPPP
jgi:hypothetical protein